jgi:hypothetical protein
MTTETSNAVTAPAMRPVQEQSLIVRTLADPSVADASAAFESSLRHDDQAVAASALEPAAAQEPAPSVHMLATPAITEVSAAFESRPTHDEVYKISEEGIVDASMYARNSTTSATRINYERTFVTVFNGEQSFDCRPMPTKKRKRRTCITCHIDSCPGKAQRALCLYYKV